MGPLLDVGEKVRAVDIVVSVSTRELFRTGHAARPGSHLVQRMDSDTPSLTSIRPLTARSQLTPSIVKGSHREGHVVDQGSNAKQSRRVTVRNFGGRHAQKK